MSDDRFIIPPPPTPEPTQPQQHPHDRRLTVTAIVVAAIALIISAVAAGGTIWQGWEAHLARVQAQQDSSKQLGDVERSRSAAEKSAESAQRSADAAWKSVGILGAIAKIGRKQIENSERMFSIEHEPEIGLNGMGKSMFDDPDPHMVPGHPTGMAIGLSNFGSLASRCKIRGGGEFTSARVPGPDSDLVAFPGLISMSKGSSMSLFVDITPDSRFSPASGHFRLYYRGDVDCEPAQRGMPPYHMDWCLYFHVSKDGAIQHDLPRGCSVGKDDPQ